VPIEKGLPIHEDHVWNALSFTRNQSNSSSTWTGKLRASLVQLVDNDGAFLESEIEAQASGGVTDPVDENASSTRGFSLSAFAEQTRTFR